MGYQLANSHWLDKQVSQMRSVCIDHLEPDTVYTLQELLDILAEHATYTPAQMVQIRDRLILQGIIEES